MSYRVVGNLCALVASLCLLSTSALCETWTINAAGTGDFPTIQAAFDASSVKDGDFIILADGTFTGLGNRNVICNSKTVTIKSASGNPELCIIDCQGSGNAFGAAEDGSTIQGIQVRNGYKDYEPGAIGGYFDDLTFAGCIFADNSSGTDGGAMGFDHCDLVFTECIFARNHSGAAGGAIFLDDCSAEFNNCMFLDNDGSSWGGVIYSSGASAFQIQFTNCSFSGNSCSNGGSAIWGHGTLSGIASYTMTGCQLHGNEQGFLASGTLTFIGDNCMANIDHCAIWSNTNGGVSITVGASATMTNCTIAGNTGDGVDCFGSNISIERCIMAYNGRCGLIGGADQFTVTCCDIFGNGDDNNWEECITSGLGSNGNFSAAPGFCDLNGGDLHLCSDSWCLPENLPSWTNAYCSSVLVGALSMGCPACGPHVPTELTTWGGLKTLYR